MVIRAIARHAGGAKRLATLAVAVCLGAATHAIAAPPDPACDPVAFDKMQTVEISQSGRYCLVSDFIWNRAGPAVRVGASDVVLDLGGHAIIGEIKIKDQIGVVVDSGMKQVRIENGAIRNMQVGIRAQDVDQLTVMDIELSSVSWFGLQVSGKDNAIVHSRLSDIGYLDDGGEGDAYAVGILAGGANLVIQFNEFHNINRQPVDPSWTGEGVAVLLSEGSAQVRIADNDFSADRSKFEDTIGLWARTTNVALEGNRFENIERPVEGAYDGMTRMVGNVFEREVPVRTRSKTDASTGQRAVALKLEPTSKVALHDNQFKGYACPVQLSGKMSSRSLKTRSNRVVFPHGQRACDGAGSWYSDVLFKRKPRSTHP